MLTQAHSQAFQENGYVVVGGLFNAEEVAAYRDHYMNLRRHDTFSAEHAGADATSADPLKRYPRLMQMHRWDETSLRWLIDERLDRVMTGLLGKSPYAVQTMLYFKPPSARGQALHQDNFYLKAQPGTCIAAWMALDDCDEANGCMQIVPGSHTWPILCTVKADTSVSFTDVTVPIPEGQAVSPVLMQAGDVLFFNGAVVHGSFPNTTSDRFRRALIGHYIEGDAEQVAEFYQPALRMDGTPLELAQSVGGGSCGVWVEQDGRQVVELVGQESVVRKHE